eukprot:TRINITY_DN34049_c0_g2_i1.p2 TRINITY_DN34049_c0_g2~~TRINITY_DN34049_c0_g2_i1.p2  ORF type:complete len:100 (+),score=3.70 TRINITY_DN34049_c0_g2_i1:83-382(+)
MPTPTRPPSTLLKRRFFQNLQVFEKIPVSTIFGQLTRRSSDFQSIDQVRFESVYLPNIFGILYVGQMVDQNYTFVKQKRRGVTTVRVSHTIVVSWGFFP